MICRLSFLFFYFVSASANPNARSPEEQCVEAHMRLWALTPWIEEGSKKKKFTDKSRNYKKYKFLYQKEYYEYYNREKSNSQKKLKAEYEADSWVRCMQR